VHISIPPPTWSMCPAYPILLDWSS
jgi:hypothetical protein